MTNKDNGGPAFPCDGKIGEVRGMTLRDYFAAKASDIEVDLIMNKNSIDYELTEFGYEMKRYSITRQQARYMHADAMLEARKS